MMDRYDSPAYPRLIAKQRGADLSWRPWSRRVSNRDAIDSHVGMINDDAAFSGRLSIDQCPVP